MLPGKGILATLVIGTSCIAPPAKVSYTKDNYEGYFCGVFSLAFILIRNIILIESFLNIFKELLVYLNSSRMRMNSCRNFPYHKHLTEIVYIYSIYDKNELNWYSSNSMVTHLLQVWTTIFNDMNYSTCIEYQLP